MRLLADLTLPGGKTVVAPAGIPSGGFETSGTGILKWAIDILFVVAIGLALLYLVLGGIRWITSGGDPKAIEGARRQIIYAIIGLFVVFLAAFIINAIGGFVGYSTFLSPNQGL